MLVRDPTTGQVRQRLGPHMDHVAVLAISDDGRTVISAGWNRSTEVSVWDAVTGRLVRALDEPPFDPFLDNLPIALTPGGALVAVGREGYRIVVWDVRTGRVVATLDEAQEQALQEGDPHESHDEVAGLAFSPDGKTLASAGQDASVRLWDVVTWAERLRLDWHEGDAEVVAFSPDGASLLAAGGAGVVRAWALPEGREKVRVTGHRAAIAHLAWTPDGRSIVSVGGDDAVCVIDASTGEQIRKGVFLPRICYAIDLTPDGRLLAYQGLRSDRRVSVLEAATGRVVRLVDLRSEKEACSCRSPLGRRPDTFYRRRRARRRAVFDRRLHWPRGRNPQRIEAAGFFTDLDVSPDGRLLATRWGNEVSVYDVPTGRLRHRLQHKREWPDHDVYDLAFSPDGAQLATAGRDGKVRLWDLANGRAIRSLDAHPTGAWRVAFSADSKTLASTSLDEPVVRLYNALNGREIDRLAGDMQRRRKLPGLRPGQPPARHREFGHDGAGLGAVGSHIAARCDVRESDRCGKETTACKGLCAKSLPRSGLVQSALSDTKDQRSSDSLSGACQSGWVQRR